MTTRQSATGSLTPRGRTAGRRAGRTDPRAFVVRPFTPDAQPLTVVVNGRVRWALERLVQAGQEGCTPILQPAPRWSDYVFRLRQLGVPIETITEAHGGDYAGHHGRYVLQGDVTPEKADGRPADFTPVPTHGEGSR